MDDPQLLPGGRVPAAARAALISAIRSAFLFGPGGASYTRSCTTRPPTICSSRLLRALSGVTLPYQTLSGEITTIGPVPHCLKRPALLTRTVFLSPGAATPS